MQGARFTRAGIPRQRLQDYLRGGSRIPDAEITLRLLHRLLEMRNGRDPTRQGIRLSFFP